MMKFKSFYCDPSALDSRVSDWVKNRDIKIVDVKLKLAKSGYALYTVFYTENK